MGVESVADGHHLCMASEHVATDLPVPSVRWSRGADSVSSLLRDAPLPAIASRRFATMTFDATQATGGPAAMAPMALSPLMPPAASTGPALPDAASQRLTELLAALSVVLDSAERRPAGHALRTAYLSARIAAQLSLPDDRRSTLLYAGLLTDIGTTGPGADPDPDVTRSRRASLSRYRRDTTPAHLSRPHRARAVVATLGLPVAIAEAVATADEHWDGRGPAHTRGDRIPRDGRLLALASAVARMGPTAADADVRTGPAAMAADIDRMLRVERGRSLDPGLVDEVLRMGRAGLWAELAAPSLLERLLELEPHDTIRWTHDRHLDAVAVAFADVVDTRTPRMGRHGRRVAAFAVRTGTELGLESHVLTDLRRAALLHDIGKLLVPIATLEKPAELTEAERRVVDEHARVGAAVLARSRAFARLAPLTVAHHERLDGNGMFPAAVDESVALAARVVALSDRYEAMTAERPYRPLLSPPQVWSILDEVVGEPMARIALRALRRAVVDAD